MVGVRSEGPLAPEQVGENGLALADRQLCALSCARQAGLPGVSTAAKSV